MLRRKSSLDSSASTRSVSFSRHTTVLLIERDTELFDGETSITSASSDAEEDKVRDIPRRSNSTKDLLHLRLKDLTAQMRALRRSMVSQNDLMDSLRDVTGGSRKNDETDRALENQLEELRKVRAAQAHLQEALRLVNDSEM